MPYGRYRYQGRRRTYRRRRYSRRRPAAAGNNMANIASVANTAWKMGKIAMSVLNSELKHYDETNAPTPDTATGSVVSIVRGMAQGDTNNTFQGNSILLKSIQCRGSIVKNATATTTRVRYMLVRDSRPQSSVPAITDILSAASILGNMNIDDQIQRFRVLYDRTYVVSNVAGCPPNITFNYYVKQSHHIKFNDSAVPVLNDYLLLAISDEATNTPTVTTASRLRYYDN